MLSDAPQLELAVVPIGDNPSLTALGVGYRLDA